MSTLPSSFTSPVARWYAPRPTGNGEHGASLNPPPPSPLSTTTFDANGARPRRYEVCSPVCVDIDDYHLGCRGSHVDGLTSLRREGACTVVQENARSILPGVAEDAIRASVGIQVRDRRGGSVRTDIRSA